MENNRDDILNELIKYYDGDPEDRSNGDAEEKTEEQGMDDTRVIVKKPEAPAPEEKLGNTITVSVKKDHGTEPDMQSENIEEKPSFGETRTIPPQKHRPKPATEEVLGNLDIEGRPIYREDQGWEAPYIEPAEPEEPVYKQPRREVPAPSQTAGQAEPEEQSELEKQKKKSGIWYAVKPLVVTLIICAVIAAAFKFYITDTGFIGVYKYNFNNNMRHIFNMFGVEWNPGGDIETVTKSETGPKILAEGDNGKLVSSGYTEKDNVSQAAPSEYKTAGEDKTIIPFADAGNSAFSEFRNGVVCATTDKICYINKQGRTEWSHEISVANPIISARGNYIAVGSKGGTRLSLYKKDKLVYSVDVQNKVRSLAVSEKGDTVLITEKTSYKGAVALVNKKGELAFSWSSGTNYITAATVLKNRKIAVALSNTDASVTSFVVMFDIKSTEPTSGAELKDSLIYSLATDGRTVMVNGDNCAALLTGDSNIKYDNRFNDVYITHSANDRHGYRVITYTDDNIPVMEVYNPKGKITDSGSIEATPDFTAINMTTVLYNNGRDVICGKVTDDKKTLYTAPRDIKKLLIIDTESYMIVYEDGLEIIRI